MIIGIFWALRDRGLRDSWRVCHWFSLEMFNRSGSGQSVSVRADSLSDAYFQVFEKMIGFEVIQRKMVQDLGSGSLLSVPVECWLPEYREEYGYLLEMDDLGIL